MDGSPNPEITTEQPVSLGSTFALTAAAVAGFVVINLLRFRALQRVGVQTEGLVVDALEQEEDEGENLVVAFTSRQGATHQIVTRAASFGWRRKIGHAVTVTYDPGDPRRARIHDDVKLQTWTGTALAAIFAVIGVALLLR